MVQRPVTMRGSRSIWMLFDTASMPVYVPPPSAKACSTIPATAIQPIWPARLAVSCNVSGTRLGNVAAWPKMPKTINPPWVRRKPTKIGIRMMRTSLMPRRLAMVSRPMMAISAGTFQPCQWRGRRLNRASTPLATDIAAVRMKLTIRAEPEISPA